MLSVPLLFGFAGVLMFRRDVRIVIVPISIEDTPKILRSKWSKWFQNLLGFGGVLICVPVDQIHFNPS